MAKRLDAAPWRPIHRRIAALGVGWALDAFEVQIIGSVIPAIADDFGLSEAQQTAVFVIWFVGIGLGATLFGFLADRFGRRRMFAVTLGVYSVAALCTALAPNYAVFMVFRFITGLGVGGEYSAVASAISEFMPARIRGRTNALVMASWAVGGIVAGLVGIVFVSTLLGAEGWRYALLFGAISALYALYVRRLIPESPRWLASQGRLEEANHVIEQVSGIPAQRAVYDRTELPRNVVAQLRELWRDYRGRLLYGMALDFSEAAGYYGLFTFVSVFVLTEGVVDVSATAVPYYYVVANVGALAGGILVSRTLDARGRKPTLFWAYTAAAVLMMGLAVAADSGSPWLTLLAFTAAVFGASCAWMSAYPTFSELYPTHLRATGVGAAVAVGRVGAILGAVILAQMAASFGLWSAFATLGGLWLLGSVAAAVWWWRGIEARGIPLEQLART